MLSLRSVSAGYGKIAAVHDVSLEVNQGEIVVLLGANGAGKSTLLRTISGAMKPTKGQILFQGKRIDGKKAHEIVRLGIVQVQEGRGILNRMTVRENLEMGAFLRSDPEGIARDTERVFVRFPRIKERLNQYAGTLSGGEQQMLSIGRALLAKPHLLLLDEPSLGLSPGFVEFIFDSIREFREKDGYTILLVEQNANQALDMANRGYVLETGRMVLEGTGQDLLHNEKLQKAYLGKGIRTHSDGNRP
jgi:branched-chain amino acid transport system ATP-binding protein